MQIFARTAVGSTIVVQTTSDSQVPFSPATLTANGVWHAWANRVKTPQAQNLYSMVVRRGLGERAATTEYCKFVEEPGGGEAEMPSLCDSRAPTAVVEYDALTGRLRMLERRSQGSAAFLPASSVSSLQGDSSRSAARSGSRVSLMAPRCMSCSVCGEARRRRPSLRRK